MHVWSGEAGEVATGVVDRRRRRTCSRRGPGRRSRGRWRVAVRARSAASSSTPGRSGSRSRALFLLGLIDLAAAALDAHARPARAALVRRLACVLQPRRGVPERAARRPAARLPARAHGVDRLPATAAAGRQRARLARLGARRRDALPRRLPRRAERRQPADGDRRRLRRRDRRRPHPRWPRAVRDDAGRWTTARRAGRPTPTARSATGSRRTAAARRRTRAATPTARSPTSPTCPPCSPSAGAAAGTRCPAAHATVDRVRPARARGPRRSSAAASAAPASPRRSPSAGRRTRSRPTR